MLRDAATRHGIRLSTLIAETGLWVNPDVHKKRLAVGASGACFPDRRRYRAGQGGQRGQRVGALTLDDHSYANVAITRALGDGRDSRATFASTTSGFPIRDVISRSILFQNTGDGRRLRDSH